MLKVIQVKIQEHTSCKKNKKKKKKLPRLTNRSEALDRSNYGFSRFYALAHQVIKVSDLIHIIFKENPKARFVKNLEVLL